MKIRLSFISLVATLLASNFVLAQPAPYRNLVLEGGGIRGFAYVGAFEVLDSLGILKNIERVGGTSAGAIQATLLAVGYTPSEMKTIAAGIPLKEFNDGFIAGGLSRLSRKFGFYKGERINGWMTDLISQKTGNPNITFRQLHDLRPSKNYRDLYITGTDLTYRTLRTFSYETFPDMRVADALRISFAIPLYYEPVIINDSGRVLREHKGTFYHLMVDGGLLANYPLKMFDEPQFRIDSTNTSLSNPETLGLLLDKPEQALSANTGGAQINSLHEYFKAVYETVIDKPNPDEPTLRRTIIISHLNLPGRVRKLKVATINQLVESGRAGVRNFFESKQAITP